jgi:hypothetical protein
MTDKPPHLTHATGAPVSDNLNRQTAGRRGPALLQDIWLIEGLRDDGARKAAQQRIVKEIRARQNPRSFDGTEFASPAALTSGLDANQVADISTASADMSCCQKAIDELWQRAMKTSPRAEGLRDDGARKAAQQRIVKEIRARRNLGSFDGTEFASSLGDV